MPFSSLRNPVRMKNRPSVTVGTVARASRWMSSARRFCSGSVAAVSHSAVSFSMRSLAYQPAQPLRPRPRMTVLTAGFWIEVPIHQE